MDAGERTLPIVTAANIVRLARPSHWIKNVIVLFPVVFSQNMGSPSAWGRALLAAVGLCLASSACYIFNDIRDRRKDRLHPAKRDRPLAAGRVGVGGALLEAAVLLAVGCAAASVLGTAAMLILAAYVLLQVIYTLVLKDWIIIDVIGIALGFVLRAAAGAAAINVEPSPWLIVCTFTICLFMGFCKRRLEAAGIGDAELAARHRATLPGYTPGLLTHLTTLSAGIAVVSYLLYATSAATVERFGTVYLAYTLPIVIYAIFRFEMLSTTDRYADPTELILRDRPFQLSVVAWIAAVLVIIERGPAIHEWFAGLG